MCQMRVLKEYKDNNKMDFATCHYLHYVAAKHTDLFENVFFLGYDEINNWADTWREKGYEKMIEFTIDWGRACQIGMTKAWGEHTFGFIPSEEKPYFLLSDEEKVTAECQYGIVMRHPHPNKPVFRKSIVLNLESVSSEARGFRQEDWERVIDMIPKDVAIFYPVPISWTYGNPLTPRPNLFIMAGWPVGLAGALSQLVDCVFVVHSGPLMLAYACNAKKIVHICFLENGSTNLVHIPEGQCENFYPQNNREVDWNGLQDLINRNL